MGSLGSQVKTQPAGWVPNPAGWVGLGLGGPRGHGVKGQGLCFQPKYHSTVDESIISSVRNRPIRPCQWKVSILRVLDYPGYLQECWFFSRCPKSGLRLGHLNRLDLRSLISHRGLQYQKWIAVDGFVNRCGPYLCW